MSFHEAEIPVITNTNPRSVSITILNRMRTGQSSHAAMSQRPGSVQYTAAGNVTGANVTASGTANYLGLWTAAGTVHFAPDPNNPGRLLSSANMAFVAANGDRLQVMLNGNLDPAAGADMGILQFVGGTGRFVAASGSGHFVVELNPATGVFKTTAVAAINF